MKKTMKFHFSPKEKIDLLKAWAALSFAFAVLISGRFSSGAMGFIVSFAVAGATLGAGFVCHELSHKFLAQKYGCWAEFRSFDQMLVLAILMSFFGFIFAAPGGVMLRGRVSRDEQGRISSAGIIANMAVAALFFAFFLASNNPFVAAVAGYGMFINSLLAVFNLIPFGNFDGRKVLAWNKLYYGLMAAAAIALMALSNWIAMA